MSNNVKKMSLVDSPTSSRSVTETVNGSHQFVIQGYSLAKGMGIGKHIASDNFTAGGHQWAVHFFPDGKHIAGDNKQTYVSLFVVLTSDGIDVRALFELILVDQSGKEKHKVYSHFDRSLETGPYTLKYRGSMWGYKRFYKRALLETSDYLKDDCLKINCTVGVVVSATHHPSLPSIQVPESDIESNFGMLLENMEGSDVIFNVAGETFNAHKLVLAARSPVFRSSFSEKMGDAHEIVINHIEPKVFKAMLYFIYTDELNEDVLACTSASSKLSAKLLAVADEYVLCRLKRMCESRICKDISVNSVGRILALADTYHAVELKAICLRFASENLAAVMRSDGFKYLKTNHPALQSEILKTVAGCEESYSSGDGGGKTSVCAQLSDDGDTNSRKVAKVDRDWVTRAIRSWNLCIGDLIYAFFH